MVSGCLGSDYEWWMNWYMLCDYDVSIPSEIIDF